MSEKENMELDTSVSKITNETSKAPDKAIKAEKKGKPAEKKKFGSRIARYLRDMKGELKKVIWPTKKQTIQSTGVVITCVIVVGAFVWVFDAVAGQLIGALLHLFGA